MSRRPGLTLAAALSTLVATLTTVALAHSTSATAASVAVQRLDGDALPFARAEDDLQILEGRVVTQDLDSKSVCKIDMVVERRYEPTNVRGCMGLDDVKVVAYDANRNIVGSALTYASDREDGPAHGYFYLHVPAGKKYFVEFSKSGYKFDSDRQVVVKGGDARGGRSWGGLELRDLGTSLTVDKGADHTFHACERVEIPQTLKFTSKPPKGYPVAPYGKGSWQLDGRGARTFPDVVKEKWEGKFVSTFGPYAFSPGQHRMKLTQFGRNYPGAFPDIEPASTMFFFRILRGCAAGRPVAPPADQPAGRPATAEPTTELSAR